ncbi:MAG: N-acetyltransferase family protein [Alphaproteobacteria bacterium]|nr:N-acetyltransferase family protein [Alphaproteobacteria bacterium]
MRALSIRPATPADIPAIAAIYGHHVRHGLASFELDPPDEAELARRQAEILGRGLPYLAAMLDERLAGYAYAGPYRSRPAYRFAVEDSIYVDPSMTGQGVGRALLPALIAECERRGLRQMIAVIGDSANRASIGLHAGFGFVRIGTLPAIGFKFGRWVDSVLMQRALGPGDATLP